MTNAEMRQLLTEFVEDFSDFRAPDGSPIISLLEPPVPAPSPAVATLQKLVAAYLAAHPDSIQGTRKRPTYSLEFVAYVIELIQPGVVTTDILSYQDIADGTGVPLRILRSWFQRRPTGIRLSF